MIELSIIKRVWLTETSSKYLIVNHSSEQKDIDTIIIHCLFWVYANELRDELRHISSAIVTEGCLMTFLLVSLFCLCLCLPWGVRYIINMAPKTTLWKKVTDCSTDEVEDEYIASVVATEMERLRKEFMDHLLQKDKIIDNLLQELSNLKKSVATLNKRVNDIIWQFLLFRIRPFLIRPFLLFRIRQFLIRPFLIGPFLLFRNITNCNESRPVLMWRRAALSH